MKNFNEVYQCDSVTLNVTNNCNLHCTYCFEHEKNPNMMSPQTAIDIIDAAYREVDKEIGVFTINLFGGEPLLNWPTIKALIDHCNEKKYKVKYGITSNLTLLNDEMIKYVDDNAIMLLVSIDSGKVCHDRNRCNSYDLVVKNIKRLIDANLTLFVEARITILPADTEYVIDEIKHLISLGVHNICPMPVTDVKWTDEDLLKLQKYYTDAMQLYVDLLNTNGDANISIKNTDEVLVNIMSPKIDDPIMCPIYSNKWCAFDTNGDIYPCHQGPTSEEPFKADMLIGNVYRGVDETKINNEHTYASYAKDMCKDCAGKSICKGGCPTENMRMSGKHDEPSDSYCKVQIALVNAVKQYQKQIISATNIRSRRINILKENIKIKEYVDMIFEESDLNDALMFKTRVLHLQEMINNFEDKLFPTFREYIDSRLSIILAYFLEDSGMTLKQVEDKLKEENNG